MAIQLLHLTRMSRQKATSSMLFMLRKKEETIKKKAMNSFLFV
ncbi:hypothetical protein T12_5839 [Trichinella patagoniensis]|uniref:Uncharacterized protein n=1 Tax=Trichinella patagoniensis TaxID=990121 RepID=A0A0V0XGV2_9BILA|nr:hypothetical protein T12_5839 [Trichinella patagoniensis]